MRPTGVFLAIALIASSALAKSEGSRLDRISDSEVRAMAKSPRGTGSFIVRLEHGFNDVVRRDLVRIGAEVLREFSAIDSVEVRLPIESLENLASHRWASRISSNTTVRKTDAFTVSGSMASAVWEKHRLNGNGVGVAVVDSGVSQHLDMLGKVDQVAFLTGANGSILLDDCGHGTHVAGIIAGNGILSSGRNATQTFYGIARGASIISVRVLDREGQGTVGDVLAGLQWILENRRLKNIRVVNMSLGHVAFERVADDPLCRMVESLWKSGVVVVCAAGNDGRRFSSPQANFDNEGYGSNYGSVQSPGNSPFAITVGAMKRPGALRIDDRIATYSARGPSVFDHVLKPDIVAPGNRVVSLGFSGTYLNSTYSDSNTVPISDYYRNSISAGKLINDGLSLWSGNSSTYFRMSGSSMAAPVVSGAVALMLDSNPRLTPDDVKARLMVTASKWSDSNGVADVCTLGAGYLNVLEAVRSKIVAGTPALSPRLVADSKGSVWIDLGSVSNRSGIWGTGTADPRVIWGSNAVLPNTKAISASTKWGLPPEVMGGTRAVWGHTLSVDGTRAVWGSGNDVDGTRAVWGHGSILCDLSSVAIAGE